MIITHAMVLAAGLGTRLRPLTERRPKPLIEVAGRSLIDRALDHLAAGGITRAVVNGHYRADQLRAHLAARDGAPEIVWSDESAALLDTGGGVAKVLDKLGNGPFVVVNSDVIWLDGTRKMLARLAEQWDDGAMDALLLLVPTVGALGYEGRGDFLLSPDGMVARRPEHEVSPFLYGGVQLVHPRLFADCPKGAFSINLLWDRAIAAGRLYGLRHDGLWMHVGTPEGVQQAEEALRL